MLRPISQRTTIYFSLLPPRKFLDTVCSAENDLPSTKSWISVSSSTTTTETLVRRDRLRQQAPQSHDYHKELSWGQLWPHSVESWEPPKTWDTTALREPLPVLHQFLSKEASRPLVLKQGAISPTVLGSGFPVELHKVSAGPVMFLQDLLDWRVTICRCSHSPELRTVTQHKNVLLIIKDNYPA